MQYPRFLGIVAQLVRPYRNGDNATSNSNANNDTIDHINKQSIINFVRNYANNRLFSSIEKELEWFAKIYPKHDPFILEKCIDFTDNLRTVAESAGVPVFCLNNSICNEHPVKYTDEKGKEQSYTISVHSTKETSYVLAMKSIKEQYCNIVKGLLQL